MMKRQGCDAKLKHKKGERVRVWDGEGNVVTVIYRGPAGYRGHHHVEFQKPRNGPWVSWYLAENRFVGIDR